jgi:hypothetical protein
MNDYNNENIFSKRLRAGKRRTYFFDVRTTKNNDYFVTLTESKKRYDGDGYERHKIFLYKEDFNKFIDALNETINHVKTELMPDFDFDAFNHDDDDYYEKQESSPPPSPEGAIETAPEPMNTEPSQEIAEELNAPKENVANDHSSEIENPSANDEAETW